MNVNCDSTLATWKALVRSNIVRKVAELRKGGTVAMSEQNLWQVIQLPNALGPGRPGSAAQARQIFSEMIRECGPRVQSFVTHKTAI